MTKSSILPGPPVMMHHQKSAQTPSANTMVIGWMYKVYVHTAYQTNI
jgi:hypothetical protein